MTTSPLAGVVVADLTHLWAGPLCTRILADLGAEVVKVEGPRRPDPLRAAPRRHGQPEFSVLNHGKSGVIIDLNDDEGRCTFRSLLHHVDGVVDNFSPRALRNWGIVPAELAAEENLVWLSMPAFSADGAAAQLVSRGAGLEGASGLAVACGHDGRPGLLGAPLSDPLAGMHAALTFLAARADRRPQHIELAQYSVVADLADVVADGSRLPSVPDVVRDGTAGAGSAAAAGASIS